MESIQTRPSLPKASTEHILQERCPSSHPANNIWALKGNRQKDMDRSVRNGKGIHRHLPECSLQHCGQGGELAVADGLEVSHKPLPAFLKLRTAEHQNGKDSASDLMWQCVLLLAVWRQIVFLPDLKWMVSECAGKDCDLWFLLGLSSALVVADDEVHQQPPGTYPTCSLYVLSLFYRRQFSSFPYYGPWLNQTYCR